MITDVYTIGVYGKSEQDFFRALRDADIQVFCDIRRRRGVRGSQYAFVNSSQLQRKLYEMDIAYRHFLDLAPTEEIRSAQKDEDKRQGELKRNRQQLSDTFVRAYEEQILSNFDAGSFAATFAPHVERIALFCVEGAASACHRSLVAARLHQELAVPVKDI